MRCHIEVKGVRVGPSFRNWDEAVEYGKANLDDGDNWYVCPELPLSDPLPVYFADAAHAEGREEFPW